MDKLKGFYFSKCYFDNLDELANYLLYYDELHFALPGKHDVYNWISDENLKKEATIKIIGKNPYNDDKLDRINAEHIEKMVSFVKDNHHLVDKQLFFHKEITVDFSDKLAEELMSSGRKKEIIDKFMVLSEEEDFAAKSIEYINSLTPNLKVLLEQNELMQSYLSYLKKYSEDYSATRYTKASALIYVQNSEYELIHDKIGQINEYWGQKSIAKDLSAVMAYNSIALMVPKIKVSSIDEVLDIRDKLSDQLIPFRCSMRKLSTDLRQLLGTTSDMESIHKEAKYIAETKVEPAIYELQRRIELEDSKFYNKLFGNCLNWIPFLADLFFAPTPEKYFNLVKKVGSDTQTVFNELNNDPLLQDPGVAFLLGIDKFRKK